MPCVARGRRVHSQRELKYSINHSRLQSAYWILSFNDFKSAMVPPHTHTLPSCFLRRTFRTKFLFLQVQLFGVMMVNNWNTFFSSYQTIYG